MPRTRSRRASRRRSPTRVRRHAGPKVPTARKPSRSRLGLALGPEELVALLAGNALPPRDPRSGEMLAPDAIGPSVAFETKDGRQRIWLDSTSGAARQVEWTGGSQPARVVFRPEGPHLATLDGKLEVDVRYKDPQRDTGFDPELMTLTVPQSVNIQDFR